MKRFLTSLLCLVIIASLLVGGSFAAAGMDNFKKINSYQSGRFSDVTSGAWYESSIAEAYNYGLVNGVSDKTFGTGANMTLAEAVTLSARLHSIYHSGNADFPVTEPWYKSYADYAVKNKIMSARRFENLTLNATRLQFAELMAAALPDVALRQINNISAGEIPDVSADSPTYAAVCKLYRAGVLTGKTNAGHFKPADPILREEVAALVARMADPALRKTFSLKPEAGKPGTGDSDVYESIYLAIQANLEVAASCEIAETAISDPDPLISAYGAQQLLSAKELALAMAQHAANAAATAKDKPELRAVYEVFETARLGAVEAGKLVSALSEASESSEWTAATKMLEGCAAALGRAADLLG